MKYKVNKLKIIRVVVNSDFKNVVKWISDVQVKYKKFFLNIEGRLFENDITEDN